MTNPTHLASRTAVVTGASSGIGRAIALELAGEGALLHLVGRDPERLKDVAEACRGRGGQAEVHVADLGEDDAVESLASGLDREVTAVDFLVHSAGVASLGPVAEAPTATLDWHYRINLRAPYLLTQRLLPLVRRARGHIVFVNSGAGLHANAGWSQYAASKHGLRALADSLRQELAAEGVRVLSVYPGRTASPMQAAIREQEGKTYDPAALVQPEDVARQVVRALTLAPTASVTELSIRPTG